jgi:signal peptidase I
MLQRVQQFVHEWRGFCFFALLLFAGRSAIADWNRIPSGSMEPTLYVGDLVLVNRMAYDLKVPFTTKHLKTWGDPKRGDIVVFYKPEDGQRLVKRVIGTPGDRIELIDNTLLINGKAIAQPTAEQALHYPLPKDEVEEAIVVNERLGRTTHQMMLLPNTPSLKNFPEITVPDGEFFMMGDNRDASGDSRYFGFVPRKEILGKVQRVIISWDKENAYKLRTGRTLQTLV